MTIPEIRDLLAEARRYVRTNPTVCLCYLAKATVGMAGRFRESRRYRRLITNLGEGVGAVYVDPDVLIGYIDGARHELSLLESHARIPTSDPSSTQET